MVDLIVSYDIGKQRKKESFTTCFDFLDRFKNASDVLLHYPDAKNISVILFENLFKTKKFDNMSDLYEHLIEITN